MTMTESRPETDTGAASPAAPAPATVLERLLGTADHKTVGRAYVAMSLVLALLVAVLGGLLGFERVDTASTSVLENAIGQVYSLHSIGAVFLFLLPLVIGVAFVIVPLQVGASTIAFPRAAAASFWLWLVSSGVLLAAYAINGGPFGGDGEGVDLFLVAFGGVLLALLLASICIATTVVALRTTGMTLNRAPLFSWSMLVASSMWLASLPVLFATTVFLYVDHRNAQVLFGGTDGIYARVVWVFAQPQLYAFAVPALGFVADVVPVFAATRARLRQVQMALIGLVGALGFGAWTQAVFTPDGLQANGKLTEQALYIAMAVGVLLPLLGLAGGVADTLRRGTARVAAPLLFAIASLLLLLGGAAAGAVSTIRPLDLVTPDTTWRSGQAHAVLLGVAVAIVGALHYWAPKLFGRMLKSGLGLLTAALLLLGTILLAGADLVSGGLDQLAGVAEGSVRDGVEALNAVSFAGGALVTLAFLAFLVNLLASLGGRGAVDDDPWGGHTLEWATTSPPPAGNFASRPEVQSAEPLLDEGGSQ